MGGPKVKNFEPSDSQVFNSYEEVVSPCLAEDIPPIPVVLPSSPLPGGVNSSLYAEVAVIFSEGGIR